MNYNNFSLSRKKGFYLKSKEPKEGFEKVVYGTDSKVTYHKYQKIVKGIPSCVEVKTIEHEGKTLKFLELTLMEDGNTTNKISVPLKNKNSYTDEAKALISSLRGLKPNEPVSITAISKETTGKNGKKYENISIYINYDNIKNDAGKGESTGFIPFSEIPKPTTKTVAGETEYDFSPQTEFYYQELLKVIAKFPQGSTAAEPAAQTASEPVNTPAPPVSQEVLDDLPF